MCCYLLHFSAPLGSARKQAQHYLGWSDDVQRRYATQIAGHGAAIVRAAVERGITVHLARVWQGADRTWERRLKNRKDAAALCPHCSGPQALTRGVRLPANTQMMLPLDCDDWWPADWTPPALGPDWYEVTKLRRWAATGVPTACPLFDDDDPYWF